MINVSQNPNQLFDAACRHSFVYTNYQNPHHCLKDFFNDKDLKRHLKMLKQWKKVVQTFEYFEVNTITSPLFNHKMMCNLLNAAYVLHHLREDVIVDCKIKLDQNEELFLLNECVQYEDYPEHLSAVELINPFLVLNEIFKVMDLAEYHQHLYAWLTTGFSPNMILEDGVEVDVVYRNLRRLIEACWLIYVRADVGCKDVENEFESPKKIDVLTDSEDEVPAHVLTEFKMFLDVVPAKRLNKNLRKMLIDYLFYNMGGLPMDFEELLNDFYWLTDLLDEIDGKEIDPKFQ